MHVHKRLDTRHGRTRGRVARDGRHPGRGSGAGGQEEGCGAAEMASACRPGMCSRGRQPLCLLGVTGRAVLPPARCPERPRHWQAAGLSARRLTVGVRPQAVAHLREDGEALGLLLGCAHGAEGGTAVLGCARTLAGKVDWEEEARSVSAMLPAGIWVVGIYSSREREPQLQAALTALRSHLAKLGDSFVPPELLAAAVAWDPEVSMTCAPLENGKAALSASMSPVIEVDAEAWLPTAVLTRLTCTLSIAPGDASAALALVQEQDASWCVLSPKEGENVEKLVLLSSHGDSPCSDLVAGPAEAASSQGSKSGGGKGAKGGAKGGGKGGDGEAEGVCGIVGEKALLKLEQVWSHGSASGAQAATAPVLSLVSGGGGSTSSSFGLDVLAMVTQPCLHAPACTRARTPTIGTA